MIHDPREKQLPAARASSLVSPSSIGDIARYDPRLAYTLAACTDGQCAAGSGGAGQSVTALWAADTTWATGGWEIVNLRGVFSVGTAGTTVPAQMFGIVAADLWVRRVTYTVQLPNVNFGTFGPQYRYFNRLNPNIDFTLLINSYCRYTISPEATPLENIETVFECVCPAGIVLSATSNMSADLTLTRTYAADTEIPATVVITFHATRLPGRLYGSIDEASALKYLNERGLIQ